MKSGRIVITRVKKSRFTDSQIIEVIKRVRALEKNGEVISPPRDSPPFSAGSRHIDPDGLRGVQG